MTKYINCTPHPIKVGDVIYPTTDTIARVSVKFTPIVGGECQQIYGDCVGIPSSQEETKYIVSAMVFSACDRKDVVAPATGHPNVVRTDKGFIESVPCFVTK